MENSICTVVLVVFISTCVKQSLKAWENILKCRQTYNHMASCFTSSQLTVFKISFSVSLDMNPTEGLFQPALDLAEKEY